jgi:hypothetical protein
MEATVGPVVVLLVSDDVRDCAGVEIALAMELTPPIAATIEIARARFRKDLLWSRDFRVVAHSFFCRFPFSFLSVMLGKAPPL